jgi:hypothetical protein
LRDQFLFRGQFGFSRPTCLRAPEARLNHLRSFSRDSGAFRRDPFHLKLQVGGAG